MGCTTEDLKMIELAKMVESTEVVEVSSTIIKEKIIYAKRRAFSKQEVTEVLEIEVEYHMRADPLLKFERVEFVKKNADQSHTYNLIFSKEI